VSIANAPGDEELSQRVAPVVARLLVQRKIEHDMNVFSDDDPNQKKDVVWIFLK
jgi:hypothetical protein